MGFIIKIAQRLSLDRKGQASSSNLIATTSVAISLFVVTLAIAITGGFKWEIREKISGYRGDSSIEKRIEFDLYYIENWTMGFDFKILFLTIFKGFVNKNAY